MAETTLDVIIERLDNFMEMNERSHQSILEQVTKINGSVAKNTRWRHYMAGGLVISNIIIVPIVIAIIMKMM